MATSKAKKTEMLDAAKQAVNESGSVVFVQARGMAANDTNDMRGAMKAEGVGYKVIKKTLISKALDESSVTGDRPTFDGELAIAYGEDLTAPARIVREWEKKFKDNIAIAGGIFEGTYKNKAEMTEIANIPGIPVLRGMFVNIINTPIQQLVTSLDRIAEKKSA